MRRRIWLVLIALAALLGVVATGGFETAQVERGLTVAVVDDSEAYLGYDEPDHTIEVNGTATVELVKVTNRFPDDLTTVDTIVEEGDSHLSVDNVNDNVGPLMPGDTATITGEVTCSAQTTATVTVSVAASGDEVEAFLDGSTQSRQLQIECT